EPAPPFALEKRRHAVLDAGSAQDLRVPGFDQHRSFGVLGVMADDAERAQLVGAPARSANSHRRLSLGRGSIIKRCRVKACLYPVPEWTLCGQASDRVPEPPPGGGRRETAVEREERGPDAPGERRRIDFQ